MGLRDIFRCQQAHTSQGTLTEKEYQRMGKAHAKLSEWGLAHLKLFSPLSIVELGCGDGRNVAELLRMFPQAHLTGVDLSSVAVALAEKRNHGDIVTKRCAIVQGDVGALPFADGAYDMATAFETIYFWPGPLESFREVYRVLKSGGLFVIVNKIDGEEENVPQWAHSVEGLQAYDKFSLIRLLKEAGFNEFSVDRLEEKHWLCVIARK